MEVNKTFDSELCGNLTEEYVRVRNSYVAITNYVDVDV